jgi:hypothetical protein
VRWGRVWTTAETTEALSGARDAQRRDRSDSL